MVVVVMSLLVVAVLSVSERSRLGRIRLLLLADSCGVVVVVVAFSDCGCVFVCFCSGGVCGVVVSVDAVMTVSS